MLASETSSSQLSLAEQQQQRCGTESASQPAAEAPNVIPALHSEGSTLHHAVRWSLRCVAGALRQLHSDHSPASGATEAEEEVLHAVGVIQARALPIVAATFVTVADDAACTAALEVHICRDCLQLLCRPSLGLTSAVALPCCPTWQQCWVGTFWEACQSNTASSLLVWTLLQVVQSLPDAQAASMQLLAHLSRLVASEAPPPDHQQLGAATGSRRAFAFDEEQGLLQAVNPRTASPGMQDARWPAQRQRALLSLLQLLTAMAGGYERDKGAFKQQLKRKGAGVAAEAGSVQPAAQLTAEGAGFDYMQVRFVHVPACLIKCCQGAAAPICSELSVRVRCAEPGQVLIGVGGDPNIVKH